MDPDKAWNAGILAILAGILGAKLLLVVTDWSFFKAHPGEIFSLTTLQAGGVWSGGFAAAVLVPWWYIRRNHMPVLKTCDVFAPGIALGHAIGRLGCFAAGCCYGKPTTLPWGVTFTNPLAARIAGTPLGVSLHPTQLYEAAAEFLNFLFLVWLGTRQKFAGQVAATFFMLYGIERGAIEFLRDDPGRTMMFHDTVSLMQIVSLGLSVAGALIWWRGLRSSAALPPGA